MNYISKINALRNLYMRAVYFNFFFGKVTAAVVNSKLQPQLNSIWSYMVMS